MEVPRAPSTPYQEPLSPPPSQPGESVGSDGADPDSAMAVQLASQSSHLTLSASGNDAEGHRAICMRPCAPWTPITRTDALTSLSNSGAQPSPEIAQGGDQEEWQKGATTSAVDALVFNNLPSSRPRVTEAFVGAGFATSDERSTVSTSSVVGQSTARTGLLTDLPNEVLLQILSNLEVCDLLATSRASHLLRSLALSPVLQRLRLRRTRAVLPPLLTSPSRPSLSDLIRRSIFMTNTTVVSRKLARSLVAIRLQRRLAARPSPEALVQRCVLPPECVPYGGYYIGSGLRGRSGARGSTECAPIPVAPALVARRRAVERERVKDCLRRWVGSVWRGEVRSRGEGVQRWDEQAGVGRVWRLRRFWERVANGDVQDPSSDTRG